MGLYRHLDLNNADANHERAFGQKISRDPAFSNVRTDPMKGEDIVVVLIGRGEQQVSAVVIDNKLSREVIYLLQNAVADLDRYGMTAIEDALRLVGIILNSD